MSDEILHIYKLYLFEINPNFYNDINQLYVKNKIKRNTMEILSNKNTAIKMVRVVIIIFNLNYVRGILFGEKARCIA